MSTGPGAVDLGGRGAGGDRLCLWGERFLARSATSASRVLVCVAASCVLACITHQLLEHGLARSVCRGGDCGQGELCGGEGKVCWGGKGARDSALLGRYAGRQVCY